MHTSVRSGLLSLAVIVLLAASGFAQGGEFAKVGTVGADFLKLPIGARGVAMGHAFSALSNDETAMFWNPAGLVYVKETSVMLEHVNWFADIGYDAIGAAHSLNDTWTVGAFVMAMNSGDIERTTVEMPNGTGSSYSVTNMVGGASIGFALTNKFSFGANLKYIREDLDEEIASSFAIDVGMLYDTRWNTVRLAMAVRNFGPEIQLGGGYFDYDNGSLLDEQSEFLPYHFPMVFKLGVAADPYRSDQHRITVVGELEHPNDNVERVNLGTEYGFREMFFLRGGYTFRHDTLGLSAGVGAEWSGFGIDYAFSEFGILENVHRFNISFSF